VDPSDIRKTVDLAPKVCVPYTEVFLQREQEEKSLQVIPFKANSVSSLIYSPTNVVPIVVEQKKIGAKIGVSQDPQHV
jgi:hypothetical protein